MKLQNKPQSDRIPYLACFLVLTFVLHGCGGDTSSSTYNPPPPNQNPPVNPPVEQTYDPVATYTIPEEGKAAAIVEKSGVLGGLIVQVHSGDGTLLEQLKVDERYLVQGVEVSDTEIVQTRDRILSEGTYGPVSAVDFDGESLPYIDNLVNLVVSEGLGDVTMKEVMRALAPAGVAMIKDGDLWKKYVKERPEEMDEWTHYLYDAGGNPVSMDTAVKPIKHYQWIGSPRWGRHHDTTASMSAMVSANGRVFYILDEGPTESMELPAENYLVARDAFNGTILWKRAIPQWQDQWFALKSGPAYLPRRLVAVGDSVFVTLGINAPLSELDAATGETIRTFAGTDQTSEVLFSNNTLFLVVGRPEGRTDTYIPQHTYVWDSADYARSEWAWDGRVNRIAAIDYADGSTLWTRDSPIAPLSLTADANSVYFFDGSKILCLNRTTGVQRWQSINIFTAAYTTAYAPRIIAQNNVVLFSSGRASITAFSATTGQRLWSGNQPASGHYSPEDMFVIDNVVWTGATANMQSDGTFTGRDLLRGTQLKSFEPDVDIYWFHQRCYPSKATRNFIIPSRTGIEFVDLAKQTWTTNHYARGGCFYGIMPSNGLIYTPPHACACYMEAKLNGFCALGGSYASEPNLSAGASNRLEQGPAYGAQIADDAASEDWPTYRHDAGRSGRATSTVPASVSLSWKLDLGGRLSSPVMAGGRMYVAGIDTHTVYALDAASGGALWKYTAGGRVDSPPTIYGGRVLFGSNDGYVYCLRASDGVLIWRYRAAPLDRRMVSFEQVESVWPVHGSVLVENGNVYCVAGRSMFLDGGMRMLRLDPATGNKLSEEILNETNPVTGEKLAVDNVSGLDMPVGLPDILSSDGQYVYMRSQQFSLNGSRPAGSIRVRNVSDQLGEGAHVFSPVGFLDDTQFVRSYMMYGKTVKGGWGGWEVMGKFVPSGRLIVVDDQNVYGYGRKPEFLSESMVLEYQLFAADKSGDPDGIAHIVDLLGDMSDMNEPFMNYAGDWKLRQGIPMADQTAVNYQWKVDKPQVQARAMVLSGSTLFVAGPPDIVDEEDAFFALDDADVRELLEMQSALLHGVDGARLWAVSASDGQKTAEYRLDSLPVWDGMIAAGGKIYMTTMKGEVVCLSN